MLPESLEDGEFLLRTQAALFALFVASCAAQTIRLKQEDYVRVQRLEVPKNRASETVEQAIPEGAGPTQAQEVQSQEYPIGKGDRLSIGVYGRKELSSEISVRGDGTIFVPLAGDIEVEGKTPREVQTMLREKLSRYFREPNVGVHVSEYRASGFSVLGAVNAPGRFPLMGPLSTVYEAVALAHGFTPSADPSDSYVIRRSSRIPLNLEALWNQDATVEAFNMMPGDILFVPGGEQNFIAVLGHVAQPGLIPVKGRNMMLAQALALAGGPKRGAKLDEVRILRKVGAGQFDFLTVDAKRLLARGIAPMLPGTEMRAGDVLYLPQTGFSNFRDALQEMIPVIQAFTIPLGLTTDILILKDLL